MSFMTLSPAVMPINTDLIEVALTSPLGHGVLQIVEPRDLCEFGHNCPRQEECGKNSKIHSFKLTEGKVYVN